MYYRFNQSNMISCLLQYLMDITCITQMCLPQYAMDIANVTQRWRHTKRLEWRKVSWRHNAFCDVMFYCDIISNSGKTAWWRTTCNQDWINFCPGCGKVKEILIFFMNRYLMNCQHQLQHWTHGTLQLSRTQRRQFHLSTTAKIPRYPW